VSWRTHGFWNPDGQGSFVLTPTGSLNYTLHAYLADMGSPCAKGHLGVLLECQQRVRPSGCTSRFTAIPGRYDVFYNTTSSSVSGAWTAPVQEPYMVYWRMIKPSALMSRSPSISCKPSRTSGPYI